jgi:hypothetical protein
MFDDYHTLIATIVAIPIVVLGLLFLIGAFCAPILSSRISQQQEPYEDLPPQY